ncbi:MAG: hypothetical protein ACK5Z2_14725 [Bacteroidota bacterium]|jgi:hypothetical protein
MRSLPNTSRHLQELKASTQQHITRLNDAALADDENPMPESIKLWLARLALLYGVPFEHLVSNSSMLPTESIRFFYVDPNWTNALLDGALSVGTQTGSDYVLQTNVAPSLRRAVQAEQRLVRRRLASAELPDDVEVTGAVSGLLLRSQLVSGWPGLQITPYADLDGVTPIEIMRMERLSPDVMLCLFAEVPAMVVIREPKENLCFGVTGGLDGTGMLARYLGANAEQEAGTYVPNQPQNYVKPVLRDTERAVLDVIATRDLFKNVLVSLNALRPGTTTLAPADFAIQMVKVAEEQSFRNDTTTGANDCTENS